MAKQLRWYDFVPEAILAVGLGVFVVTEPSAATSGLRSAKGLLLIALASIAWVLARLVSLAFVRARIVRGAPFVLAAFAILNVVVLPAYRDKVVVETAPVVAMVSTTTTTTIPSATTTTAVGAPTPPTTAPSVTSTTVAAAQPAVIATGSLSGIDHRASGTVRIYRQPTGAHVVGLEDFDIQPGPAYVLYVVPGANRKDHAGGTRLEALRGNRGTQFYDVPAAIDLSEGAWTVLVWCETFDVPVAHSSPS